MPKLAEPPFVAEAPIVHAATGVRLGTYMPRILGDLGGLTQYGVHPERFPPGTISSVRHWHETEDEFCDVLSGELVRHENDGETRPVAGDALAWPAGTATYLIAGCRNRIDTVHDPDHDRIVRLDRVTGSRLITDGAGPPVEPR